MEEKGRKIFTSILIFYRLQTSREIIDFFQLHVLVLS